MGLIKAYDNFDESRGVCFSTYAVPVILGEIKKLFRDGGTVKVSRSLKELGMRVQAAREHTMKLCGAEPTLQQLAEQCRIYRDRYIGHRFKSLAVLENCRLKN